MNDKEEKELYSRLMLEGCVNPHHATKLKATKGTLKLLRKKQGNLADLLKSMGMRIESKDGYLFLVGA